MLSLDVQPAAGLRNLASLERREDQKEMRRERELTKEEEDRQT